MFTDVVGYSSISSQDEGRALKLLDEHRKVLQGVFPKFGGVVVKTMGDGFLVEFASAVEAVNCAVEAHKGLDGFNQGRGEDDKIMIRIGIHVGDVVHSAGDVLGDAVNVAARVQPFADVGGICVTKQVVDQVERKVEYRFVKMGMRELKNIRYSVELYKVEVPGGVSRFEEGGLDPRRVAILPFANMSADPNDRYFADGLTEELISTVSRIGELSVISRTSVMRYKDTTTPIGEIGRELTAGSVIEGSVRKAGNKVRVTAQLIEVKDDKHLWAQSYDRDLTDVFGIQADIAEKVADALRVKLVSEQKEVLERKATVNSEAYTLYLKGRFYWNERSKEGINKALKYFSDAVALDPSFALAYSGLADCYLILADRSWISYDAASPFYRKYADRAIELDGELAEAHATLGLALGQGWDFVGAEREFKRAIELSPSYAMAYHWYAVLLGLVGRHGEAIDVERRAVELDPHSSVVRQGLGTVYLIRGMTKEAMGQFEMVEKADPGFTSVYFWKALAHVTAGDLDRAVQEAEKFRQMAESAGASNTVLAWLYARTGRRDEALKLLDEYLLKEKFTSATQVAIVKFGLGETEEAIGWLQKAYEEHDDFLLYFREAPWFAGYRKDPRWAAIAAKMGLPPG
jgi:TolB-like protein/Tfp pilus assembly protein PilF